MRATTAHRHSELEVHTTEQRFTISTASAPASRASFWEASGDAVTAHYNTPIMPHRGTFNGGQQAPPEGGLQSCAVAPALHCLPAALLVCYFLAKAGGQPWPNAVGNPLVTY